MKRIRFFTLLLLSICIPVIQIYAHTKSNDLVIVYQAEGENFRDDIFVVNVDGSNRRQLTIDANANWNPRWSPNGCRIAFLAPSGIYSMNPDGTDVLKIAETSGLVRGYLWSPNSTQIVFSMVTETTVGNSNGVNIFIVNSDGTNLRTLTNDIGVDNQIRTWSPNHNELIYTSKFLSENFEFVRRTNKINIETLEVHEFNIGDYEEAIPYWSPDGSRIIFQSGQYLYLTASDGSYLRSLAGESVDAIDPQWSFDSSSIVFSAWQRIARTDADGEQLQILTSEIPGNRPQYDLNPKWSPDGEYIAFHSSRNGGGLYVMNADGSNVRQLTDDGAFYDWKPLNSCSI